MMTHGQATFSMKSWDEKTWDGKPWNEVEGRKFTRAQVTRAYQGDLEGEGTVEFLMFYREDGTASYLGLEEVVGKLGGKSGSFAVQHTGSYAEGTATASSVIVPGSGTGELAGLTGEIQSVAAGDQEQYPVTLNYDFE
jgi:hypothetical protein